MTRESPELPKSHQLKATEEGRLSTNISIASSEVQDHRPEAATPNVPVMSYCRKDMTRQGRESPNKKVPHQQPRDDSLEYHKTILVGAKSLGIEMCSQLQQAIGDSRGKVYIPGTLSHRNIKTFNEDNFLGYGGGPEDATCDSKIEAQFQLQFHDGTDWEDDLAGTGFQFSHSPVGLSARR